MKTFLILSDNTVHYEITPPKLWVAVSCQTTHTSDPNIMKIKTVKYHSYYFNNNFKYCKLLNLIFLNKINYQNNPLTKLTSQQFLQSKICNETIQKF